MTNELCLLIYIPLFLIAIILFVDSCRKQRQDYAVRQYIYFCVCLIGWFICEMLYFTLEDEVALRYLFDLKLGFVGFIAVSLFFTVAGFYRLNRLFPKWLPGVLCIVPAITAALVVLSPLHPLITARYEVLALRPMIRIDYQPGLWYYVHLFYSQGLAVSIAVTLVLNYRTLPRAYRSGSGLLFTAVACYLAMTTLGSYGFVRDTIDYNLIGLSMAGYLYHFASLVNGRPNYLHIERREVFHYLDEAVFILNGDGVIIDINFPGEKLLDSLGISKGNILLMDHMNRLEKAGKIERRSVEGQNHEDLYVRNGRFQMVYEIHQKAYHSREVQNGGTFLMLTDVTNNRLFIQRMRDLTGYDELTGLANRYGYIEKVRELDFADALPLSVIVADVDNLKEINDTCGHGEGDEVLRQVADIFRELCPKDCFLARMGGDEFIILLPRFSQDSAHLLTQQILKRVKALSNDRYEISAALGYATKRVRDENLNLLINEADQRMYSQKKSDPLDGQFGLEEMG